TVPRECLHKVSLKNISYSAEPQELLQAYQSFTKHFDGNYVRDREYYVLLQNELVITQKQMVVYRNRQGEVCGYVIFQKKKQEI
ncbi:GNAT family N-acetyltransferase, partial [Streptococcus parasanguinis]|nr:GNAT family N-acetyltransferase [Streptococcus parasanguinis]